MLYLVRHCLASGQAPDAPLTTLGHEQAERHQPTYGIDRVVGEIEQPRDLHRRHPSRRDPGAATGRQGDRAARRQRPVERQRRIGELRERDDGRIPMVVEQLSEAFGLGGRSRTTGSSSERARTAVTYRVRAAIRKIDQLHPALGRHLTNSVRTGTWCSYRPESDVSWTIERRGLTV